MCDSYLFCFDQHRPWTIGVTIFMYVCTIMSVCALYPTVYFYNAWRFTDAYSAPYVESPIRSNSGQWPDTIMQCAKDFRESSNECESLQMSQTQVPVLFHIKVYSPGTAQEESFNLMAKTVPQNTRTFQHRQLIVTRLEHQCNWWSFPRAIRTENETTGDSSKEQELQATETQDVCFCKRLC